MFELFIALFGGLFYALKIGSDKAGAKKCKKRTTERIAFHKARLEKWQSAVVDITLESKVKQSIPDMQGRDKRVDMQLAKLGKVRECTTHYLNRIESLAPGITDESKRCWDETLQFWVRIRDELVVHGVEARPIFVCGSINDWEAQVYDIDDVGQFRYKSGTLHWLQSTYFDDNLKYM